ncbi:MAG: cytochrome c4 [Gammaproteobacteria bacterium]|jgi:cytochrome c553|nr:cytochrome c4 [Gammaproteobacteria bacterium]MBT4462182.1 cytochrome c4 [Gammaproteobacteria bacterium]MBT4654428.1 cytochrome c4 [Gammaproteobacteria bacterium]MBT5116431.1 cytochrome c4 [Gammaproteobacteria bacterium]MBT5761926.1 cytochrome c4 [Gammaproteobacteria bacterium]
MNKLSLYTKISLLIIFSANIQAGDIAKGKEKSITCVACHGEAGVSPSPVWPKLAGQHESYLSAQLHEFKKGPDGKRNNAIMYGISVALSSEDIDDLSAYYSSLSKSIGTTADKSFKLGQNIYRGGNMEYKIQACIACHGPNGDGNGPAAIPVLSGQHAEYVYLQLKNFQKDIRSNDSNKMMRNIVHRMTDNEMKSVAQYIQGLH